MEEQVETWLDKACIELRDECISEDIGWLWESEIVIIAWILLHFGEVYKAAEGITWRWDKLQVRIEQLWQNNDYKRA